PAGVQKRIQENQALGKPLSEGQTPMIEPQKKGLLEGILK
ncbi:MAG: DUF3035 domain-containing protein, partial [Alphaproteobacteria bacterium]|nr:DUF3035 domain-containing protein [Alphaproteobacteria bacterium]